MSHIIFPCPKCEEKKPRTRHHILPRRFYDAKAQRRHKEPILPLCRECHTSLEEVILQEECEAGGKLPTRRYFEIAEEFLS